MAKRIGPKLNITASCFDCKHCQSVPYQRQGDSGHDVSCEHPGRGGAGYIGDTTFRMPKWCPLYQQALSRLSKKLTDQQRAL